jgi:hypothetical protein
MILLSLDATKFLVFQYEGRTHVVLGCNPPSKTNYSCSWCHKDSDYLENKSTRWHGVWDDIEDNPVFHLLCCSPECDDSLGIAIEPHMQELGSSMMQSYKDSVKVEE